MKNFFEVLANFSNTKTLSQKKIFFRLLFLFKFKEDLERMKTKTKVIGLVCQNYSILGLRTNIRKPLWKIYSGKQNQIMMRNIYDKLLRDVFMSKKVSFLSPLSADTAKVGWQALSAKYRVQINFGSK